MINLLFLSWIGGVMLSITSGMLGPFVIWRRMSCFGDALSHISLLGIVFALLLNINIFFSIIIITFISAISLISLENINNLNIEILLSIISHAALSLALILISFMPYINIDLMSYLFGDLLAINFFDLSIIGFQVLFVAFILTWKWKDLLLLIIHAEIAQVEGVNIKHTKLILMLITAFSIGISMKFFGSLIINALLIIPAATARRFSHSPEHMVIFSIFFGILSVTSGLALSAIYDTPAGPSVVVSSIFFFIFSMLKKENKNM